jgi:hypothetical protein
MDGVTQASAQAIEAVNDMMKAASAQTMKAQEKMMKVSVTTTVGAEMGKGAAVDMVA